MRNLTELGMKSRRGKEPFRPPTDGEVKTFEQHFQLNLPTDYVAFLQEFNGGRPTAKLIKTSSGYVWGVGSFHYLLPENPSRLDPVHHPNGWEFGNLWAETRTLRQTVDHWKAERPNQLKDATNEVLPFAVDGGGGNAFVFDLRQDPATVAMVIISEGFRVSPLAASFSEFIERLYANST